MDPIRTPQPFTQAGPEPAPVAGPLPQRVLNTTLLPPTPAASPAAETPSSRLQPRRRAARAAALAVAAAALVTAFAWLGNPHPGSHESAAFNWRHVEKVGQKANEAHDAGILGHVSAGGTLAFVTQVRLTDADRDTETTNAIARALRAGNVAAAETALAEAQAIAAVTDPQSTAPTRAPLPRVVPTLTPGLRRAIVDGSSTFFMIYVFDTCDQDGDVVDILVGGERFATIPLTHHGATLSIPIPHGTGLDFAVRAVRDGEGGGVTLGCRTSTGDFLTGALPEGQIVPLHFATP
jgi:hypothetical protein